MKTKFVYVVASSATDIYLEQAIISAWSLRYYNPEGHIVLICDQDTRLLFNKGWQQEYLSLFNEIKICQFDDGQSMKERSRQMKTTLRSLISGDFLYIDTDTLICRDLSYIDNFSFDIGFVLAENCAFDEKHLAREEFVSQMREYFNIDISEEKKYYNGGVFYVKDTDIAHTFFDMWHKNWIYEKKHTGSMLDQPPLMKTNIDMGHVITEMQGEMNCQIVVNYRYFHDASIIHIYNEFISKDTSINPFYSSNTYRQIKEHGFSEEWKYKVIHFKESFCSPSIVLGKSNLELWRKLHEERFLVRNLQKIREKRPLLSRMLIKTIAFIGRFS